MLQAGSVLGLDGGSAFCTRQVDVRQTKKVRFLRIAAARARRSECPQSAHSVEKLFAASASFEKVENLFATISLQPHGAVELYVNQNFVLPGLRSTRFMGVFQQNTLFV